MNTMDPRVAVFEQMLTRLEAADVVCIGCGCTNHAACVTAAGPCHWVAIDEESGRGLCSACALKPIGELELKGFRA